MDDEGIVALARAQHGCVTRAQAMNLGATDQGLRTRVATGRWARRRRGVFIVGAAAETWEQRVMAVCLAAGYDCVASFRTAARLWSLVAWSGRIQITVGAGRRVRLPGVEVHRSRLLPRADRTHVDQIPSTTFARTIVDLAMTQAPGTISGWVDTGLRRGQLDLVELRNCLGRLAGPGRPRFDGLEAVLADRLPGYGPGDSVLEGRALAILRDAGLPAPVQQHPVRRPGGTMAYVDLAYPDQLVGIELDGWAFHRHRDVFDRDRQRGNDLALLGWRMFHFTSTTSPDDLVATVRQALVRSPSPGPVA